MKPLNLHDHVPGPAVADCAACAEYGPLTDNWIKRATIDWQGNATTADGCAPGAACKGRCSQ